MSCQSTSGFDFALSSASCLSSYNVKQKLAMPWPKLWPSSTKDESESQDLIASKDPKAVNSATSAVTESSQTVQRQVTSALPSKFAAFAEPQTIIATIALTAASLGSYRFYKSYLRRIPQAIDISSGFFRRRSLVGKVTSVGDGDNFRIYHTPGGRLAGWGWVPGRRVPVERKQLKDQTVFQDSKIKCACRTDRRRRYTSVWPESMRPNSLILEDPLNPMPRMRSIGLPHMFWEGAYVHTSTR